MFCNSCGANNPDRSKFCRNCGFKFEETIPTEIKPVSTGKKDTTLSQVVEYALILAVIAGFIGLLIGGFAGMAFFFVIGLIGGFIISYAVASMIQAIQG